MKQIHQKIDEDVARQLHIYRIKELGLNSTMSDAIRSLLKEVQ
jgi:antitoxin component of RelBE/YafQ-DinJ toxin-antitoxin module